MIASARSAAAGCPVAAAGCPVAASRAAHSTPAGSVTAVYRHSVESPSRAPTRPPMTAFETPSARACSAGTRWSTMAVSS